MTRISSDVQDTREIHRSHLAAETTSFVIGHRVDLSLATLSRFSIYLLYWYNLLY
jgi:hypothetical protein